MQNIIAKLDQLKRKQQQNQQQPENPANWSMDSIRKMQKLERTTMALCILMSIICGLLLYGIFFPANAPNPGQKDERLLEKEIGEFHRKMVQLVEKANAQKATIAQLRVTIEQQAKEIGQMLNEKNSNVRKLTSVEQLGEILLHVGLIFGIIVFSFAIIAFVALCSFVIYDCWRHRH